MMLKQHQKTMHPIVLRKRIKKLEASCLLNVQGNINIKRFKLHAAFILMEIKNYDNIQKIIKGYADCPRVFLLAHVNGQYNLMIGVISKDLEDLYRYINFCGPTNKNGVLHSEILNVSNIKTPKFLPLKYFSKESQENKCGNVCRDCEAFLEDNCSGCGNF